MTISFRHTYSATEGTSKWFRGDSNIPTTGDPTGGGVLPLDTDFGDGSSYELQQSGRPIARNVSALLAMAGISLDELNLGEAPDTNGRRPMYRMTGVLLHVDIEYSNRHPDTLRPDISLEAVHAKATLAPEGVAQGWAGFGADSMIYVRTRV
jgi:hypothetical protein